MIKLIIFDAGELLFPLPRKLWAEKLDKLEKKYGIPKGSCNRVWYEVKPLIMSGEMDYLEAQELIFKKAGFGDHARKVTREWIKADKEFRNKLRPFKGVKETLLWLKQKYKIAVLSDTHKTESEKREGLKHMGIDIFDKVFCSHDLGVSKPKPEAYQKVLDHFYVKSNEAVFVAHDAKELEGAKQVGLITISVKIDCSTDFYARKFSDIISFLRNREKE
ncbi:MAG: HAD family hydrolase [Nanoarchaeota archaeon]